MGYRQRFFFFLPNSNDNDNIIAKPKNIALNTGIT